MGLSCTFHFIVLYCTSISQQIFRLHCTMTVSETSHLCRRSPSTPLAHSWWPHLQPGKLGTPTVVEKATNYFFDPKWCFYNFDISFCFRKKIPKTSTNVVLWLFVTGGFWPFFSPSPWHRSGRTWSHSALHGRRCHRPGERKRSKNRPTVLAAQNVKKNPFITSNKHGFLWISVDFSWKCNKNI